MKHSDMKEINANSVFYSVLNGNSTSKMIENDTSLSHMTVKEVANGFVQNGVFEISTEKSSSAGRRSYHYAVSCDFCSAYFEKRENFFSAILIDACGNMIERRNFALHTKYSYEKNINNMLTEISWYKGFKRCLNYFVVCEDEYKDYLKSPFILTTTNELIIKNNSNKNEIVFFDINHKKYLSVYGRIHATTATETQIGKILPIERKFIIKGDLYNEIFTSLKNATLEKMAKIYHIGEIPQKNEKRRYKIPNDEELNGIDIEKIQDKLIE